MKLSHQQFEHLFKENRLTLSLIGMSNIGKTYWSKKLCEIGVRHINCDDLIEAKLAPILHKRGYSGISDVARWMGQPHDERFTVNQQCYLSLEREVMEDIFIQMRSEKMRNTVVDTTGSFIHTSKTICDKLKKYSMVIYIEASENMKKEMFQHYLKEPKPVVFGNLYVPKADESVMQTLSRCYRQLLNVRSTMYRKVADIVIPRGDIEQNMNIHQFITLLKQSL